MHMTLNNTLISKNLLIIIIPTADHSTADVVIWNSDSSSANTGLILSQFWFTMISMMEIHLWVLHRKLHQQISGEHVKHTHICQLESTTDNQSTKTEYMNFNETILQKNLLYHIGNFQDTLCCLTSKHFLSQIWGFTRLSSIEYHEWNNQG